MNLCKMCVHTFYNLSNFVRNTNQFYNYYLNLCLNTIQGLYKIAYICHIYKNSSIGGFEIAVFFFCKFQY